MKETCETCQTSIDLQDDVYICSYECTFCESCTNMKHKFVCPNCTGELVRRPKRKAG